MSRSRFVIQAVPLLVFLLALFAFTVRYFGYGPAGAVAVLDPGRTALLPLLGAWLLEAFGLVALYLLIAERSGGQSTASRLFDGLLAGWVAWIFRGPLLVVTVVAAAGRPHAPWGRLAFGWWVLYSVCGVALAILDGWRTRGKERPPEPDALPSHTAEAETSIRKEE